MTKKNQTVAGTQTLALERPFTIVGTFETGSAGGPCYKDGTPIPVARDAFGNTVLPTQEREIDGRPTWQPIAGDICLIQVSEELIAEGQTESPARGQRTLVGQLKELLSLTTVGLVFEWNQDRRQLQAVLPGGNDSVVCIIARGTPRSWVKEGQELQCYIAVEATDQVGKDSEGGLVPRCLNPGSRREVWLAVPVPPVHKDVLAQKRRRQAAERQAAADRKFQNRLDVFRAAKRAQSKQAEADWKSQKAESARQLEEHKRRQAAEQAKAEQEALARAETEKAAAEQAIVDAQNDRRRDALAKVSGGIIKDESRPAKKAKKEKGQLAESAK